MEETKEIVRTTIDLPTSLNEKLLQSCKKAKRSRHAEMLFVLEKFFETPNSSETRKPHLIMPKAEKVKISGNGKKEKSK